MADNSTTFTEIDAFLRGSGSIQGSKVLKWMESDNKYVMCAVLHVMLDAAERIDPALSMKEYGDILAKAALRVIASGNKDDKTDYAYTDYQAAEIIRWWTVKCYNQQSLKDEARGCLDDVKEMLADLYLTGNDDVRACIVHGALEHVFEIEELQKYFEDWKIKPALTQAYEEAKEWGDWRIQNARFVFDVAERVAQKLKERGNTDVVVHKPKIMDHGVTVEWPSSDQIIRQQLEIRSHLGPSDLYELMTESGAVGPIVDYIVDAKNWEKSYGKENAYSVTLWSRRKQE